MDLDFDTARFMDFVLKIGVAMAAGLLIGLEREYKGKHAGLKTNTLVAIGAAIFVLASLKFQGTENTDVTRVLSQVVTGIGFLGGGVILHKQNAVKGLTTAATIWCSAGVGCLAALGMFEEVTMATLVILAINVVFGYVDSKLENRGESES